MENSMVIDPAPLLAGVGRASLYTDGHSWTPAAHQGAELQKRLLSIADQLDGDIYRLRNVLTKASIEAHELNRFLVNNGLEPQFTSISSDGIGVATITKLSPRWMNKTTVVEIFHNPDAKFYRGFELREGAEFFWAPGYDMPIAKLRAELGSFWVIPDVLAPDSEVSLMELATRLSTSDLTPCHDYGAIQVPAVEFYRQLQLDWLLGMRRGHLSIEQVFQQVSLRIDETRAFVMSSKPEVIQQSQPHTLAIDRPFVGFFTQNVSRAPIGAFWANNDAWLLPAPLPAA